MSDWISRREPDIGRGARQPAIFGPDIFRPGRCHSQTAAKNWMRKIELPSDPRSHSLPPLERTSGVSPRISYSRVNARLPNRALEACSSDSSRQPRGTVIPHPCSAAMRVIPPACPARPPHLKPLFPFLMAGHNKWSKVKQIKGRVFTNFEVADEILGQLASRAVSSAPFPLTDSG